MSQTSNIEFIAFNKNPTLFARDPSYIYRCKNLAHALESSGCCAILRHIKGFAIESGTRYVVLHRPRYSLRLKWFITKLRKQNIVVIADVDDLVFDVAFAEYSPAVAHGILSLKKVKKAFRTTSKALSLVDHITVSTELLAKRLRAFFPDKPVTVIHNCVHYTWRDLDLLPIEGKQREKIITYSPGTRSHDQDFREILEPLQDFLADHSDVKLKITGPLDVAVKAREGQVLYQPKQTFTEYVETVRSGWANLLPLEQTPFNACKSGLKAIEAGYWGIPTICSPNPDAQRLTSAGAIIADNKQDWFDVLERMLDGDEYKCITDGLLERTLAVADIYQQAELFQEKVLDIGYRW